MSKFNESSPEFIAVQTAVAQEKAAIKSAEIEARRIVDEKIAKHHLATAHAVRVMIEGGASNYNLGQALGTASAEIQKRYRADAERLIATGSESKISYEIYDDDDSDLDRTHYIVVNLLTGPENLPVNFVNGNLLNGEDQDGIYQDSLDRLELYGIYEEVLNELNVS